MRNGRTYRHRRDEGDEAVICILGIMGWILAFAGIYFEDDPCRIPLMITALVLFALLSAYAAAVDIVSEGGSDGPHRRKDTHR